MLILETPFHNPGNILCFKTIYDKRPTVTMGLIVEGRGAYPIVDWDLYHSNCIRRPTVWEFLIVKVKKE